MNHQKDLPAETRLNKVKSEFKIWRTTRKNRNPIPADLWEHAVELYPAFTISKISKTLALSYTGLKKRVHHKPENFSVRRWSTLVVLREPIRCFSIQTKQ